jgi:hypothetical protein
LRSSVCCFSRSSVRKPGSTNSNKLALRLDAGCLQGCRHELVVKHQVGPHEKPRVQVVYTSYVCAYTRRGRAPEEPQGNARWSIRRDAGMVHRAVNTCGSLAGRSQRCACVGGGRCQIDHSVKRDAPQGTHQCRSRQALTAQWCPQWHGPRSLPGGLHGLGPRALQPNAVFRRPAPGRTHGQRGVGH